MERLEQEWATVINSSSAEEEADAVASLRELLTREGIAFTVVVIDDEGSEIPYSEFSGEQEIGTVRFTFLTGDGGFDAPEWSPKDEENFYAFFRE